MPSNPYKEDRKARLWFEKIIQQIPSEGMLLDDVVREAGMIAAISLIAFEKYIVKYYVNTGVLELNEGIIKRLGV